MRQRGPDCPFISASAFTPQSLWMRRPERRSAQTQVVEQAEEFLRIGPQWNTMTGKRCSIKCGVKSRSVLMSVARQWSMICCGNLQQQHPVSIAIVIFARRGEFPRAAVGQRSTGDILVASV